MKLSIAFPAAIAVFCFCAPLAFAGDESGKGSDASTPAGRTRVLVFGDGAARFNVERDARAGRVTFRLADPAVRLDRPPVVVMTSDTGPREVALTAVEGQPGAWYWTGDAVRAERFDGSMRVIVAGKTYTSPLTTVWSDGTAVGPVTVQARYGGRVLTLPDCGTSVEVVQDPATGTLTIYSFEDVVVTEAPVITITESSGPTTVTLTRVDGRPGVWMTKHTAFKTTTTSARIRLLVNGKPCETDLSFAAGGTIHGGQIVTVDGGPKFEVVRSTRPGEYTFYAVDETIDGRVYTIEHPTVVVSGRTYELTRVEGEPRAWRLVGLDAAGSDSRDAQLNITLFGKTLSTRLGLSGFGIGVK